MLGQVLALTVRALRQDARSVWPHLLRLAFALYLLVMLAFVQMEGRSSAPGLIVFNFVCWANFALISIGGISVFATAITEEKEEATLGLLRMAGIGPTGLLLGKSTTRLISAFLILAVQFPFTLLAITLGGVIWAQVIAAYVALAAYLVMVANVGLLASVICSRSPSAATLSGLTLSAWMIGVPVLDLFAQGMSGVGIGLGGLLHAILEPLWSATIPYRLFAILNLTFNDEAFTWPVYVNLAGGAALFVVSSLTFDWFTRDHLVAAPPRFWLTRRRVRRPTAPAADRGPQAGGPTRPVWNLLLSPSPSWSNALVWKDFHFLAGGYITAVFKLIGYFVLIVALIALMFTMNGGWSGRRGYEWSQMAGATFGVGLLGGGVELAVAASRVFWEEMRWQTWQSLVMLPRSLAYIAYSKVAGFLLSLLPALFWVGVGTLMNLSEVLDSLFRSSGGPDQWAAFWLGLAMTVLYYTFFVHVAAYASLWLKWGALPLTFVVMVFSLCCCNGTMLFRIGGGTSEVIATLLVGDFFLVAGNIVLHALIGARLKQLSEA